MSLITSLASTGGATGRLITGSLTTMAATTQLLPYPVLAGPAADPSTGWAARRGPECTDRELGPFPRSLPPNPAGTFQRTRLSSDYAAFATGVAWMTS